MSQTYPIRITVSADTRDLKEVREELERTSKTADGMGNTGESSSRRFTSALSMIKREINNLAERLQNYTTAAASNSRASELMEQHYKQLEKAARGTTSALEQLTDANRAASRAEESASAGRRAHNEVMQQGEGIGRSLASGIGLAIAGITAIAIATAKATSELLALNRELENAERQLGISSQVLQVWGIAADKVGLSSEKMRDIFKDVSDKLGDLATTGGGEAKDVIERLKLNINDLINMQPDQALLKIAKAMDEVKNISQHDKIFLMEALADEGSALLPLLKDNAKALREIEDAANRRGVIITPAEEQILNKANAVLSEMKTAASGVSQELGLMGSELLIAFGDNAISGLDNAIELTRALRSDIGLLTDAWSESASGMLADATRLDGIANVFLYIYDIARQVLTYLPAAANAAFTAAHAYGEMFGHGTAAAFYMVKAAGAIALAAILDIAGGVFGGMASMAGKAVAFILDRFANMVSGLSSLGSFFSKIPGLESFGAAISGAEGNIKAMADAARASGDVVGKSFAAQSASFKAVAADSLATANAHKAAAGGAKMAAAASIDYAKSYIQQKEASRDADKLVRKYNDDLYGNASALDRATGSSKKYTATAKDKEGAEKAGKAATEAAKKAHDEAAKAVEALAKAHEKILDLFTKENQKHDVLTLKLNQGADAARALELQYQNMHEGKIIMTDAQAKELVQLENVNKALEAEIKRREDVIKAVEKANEAVAKSGVAMDVAKASIYASDEAMRSLILSHETGYTKASAATQAHNEALTESYKNQRDVVQDLSKLNRELAGIDAQMAALKSGGVIAMQAEEVRQSAINELKEKGVGIESALGQQYLTAKAAIEAKTNALKAEQEIQKSLKDIGLLDKEIAATKAGAAALTEFNVQRDIQAKLEQLNVSAESALGKQIAETTRQLAAKNKQLQIAQTLTDGAKDSEWLKREIEATMKGEDALKAFNVEKRISTELDRLGIAAGTQAAAQVEAMIRGQEGLKEKLASIQELRQPISQFFSDVLDNGKNAFKNLGDYILSWLKKLIVEFATNKLMLSIGVDATGKGGLLGGIGDKITGIFGKIGDKITSAVTGLFGSSGLGGILGSVAGALGPIGLIAGAASLLKGLFKKEGNLVFSQGMNQGQQLTGQGGHAGQEHYRQTAFGLIGATSASNKIGRQEGFVPEFHKMMDAMVALDEMIAKTIPNSVGKIKEALAGMEQKGFSTAEMLKQRYVTIAQSLSTDLQAALAGGKELSKMTAEEIVGRFQYMAQVAESGLIPTLQQLGMVGTQTNESVLALAMGLSTAMGGIDKAKAALDAYYQAAYTDAERTAMSQQAAKTALDAYNQSLGLSGSQYIDTVAKLRARIEAEDASTAAGQKNIATLLSMVDAIKTLSGTAEEAAAKLKGQWDDFNNAAYTDAQREAIAKKQAQSLVDQFNKTYGTSLANIIDARQLMRTIDTTTEAGKKMQQSLLGLTGSLVTLGGTAQQIKEKIAGLKEGIKDLAGNLYGKTTTSTTTTSNNQAALTAAQAMLDSLRSRYDIEKQRIDDINQASQDAYRKQIDYYNSLKSEAESLRGLARGFADESRNAADTLKAAQLDYNNTLRAAQSGDVDAAGKMGEVANRLKAALGAGYNNDDRAALGIRQLESQLLATAGMLDRKAGTAPTDPGTIISTLLKTLESQIKAQESAVSSLQQLASTQNNATTDAVNRKELAKELAEKIGALGLATDKSAFDILAQMGVKLSALAADFGIDINALDTNSAKNISALAKALNTDSLKVIKELGLSLSEVAKSFGIDITKLDTNSAKNIGVLAKALNTDSLKVIKDLGLSLSEVAKSFGIDVTKLDGNILKNLGNLAKALNTDPGGLADKLGLKLTNIATAIGLDPQNFKSDSLKKLADISKSLGIDLASVASKLGIDINLVKGSIVDKVNGLSGVPENIKKGLEPYLKSIAAAPDAAGVKSAIGLLQTYINSLPKGIKDNLNEQLGGILGFTSKTDKNTADTKTETLALRSIKSAVDNTANYTGDLTAYTRDQVNARGIQLALQNSRALNQHAAKIGKEGIPSFAVGSDKLPSDMLANVHQGEMIFTARQSDSLRDLAIYNQAVIPQIASYLSEIAANDNEAPIFIQPVLNAPVRNNERVQQLEAKLDELIQEQRRANAKAEESAKRNEAYQYAIANNTDKTQRVLNKWDVDGQPEERVA